MKKNGASFVMISSAIIIVFVFYYFKFKYPDQNTVLATINDEKITLWHLKEYSRKNYGFFDESKINDILDLMINQKILLIHAENTGVIRNVLQPQFFKQEKYSRDKLMLELFFEIHARETIKISTAEMKEYYDKQPLFTLKSISFPYSDPKAEEKILIASNELNKKQDFNLVYNLFFPKSRFIKPGIVGISNYFSLPDFLIDHSIALSKTGQATNPIESEFGFTVYYRDKKPGFRESKRYIENILFQDKATELQLKTYNEIKRHSRLNFFSINVIFNQKNINLSNDILATNNLTNDSITERDLSVLLSDLYGITNITQLTFNELIEYTQLIISQKVILSLAEQNNYFDHQIFLSKWNREQVNLKEAQSQEIIDYMMTRFYEENLNIITEKDLMSEYKHNYEIYRKTDFFKLQVVVTNNRHTAFQAYNDALKNKNFNQIVETYSNDPFASMSYGLTAYLTKSDLIQSYDYLLDKSIGDIVSPIEIEVGLYHIYKVIDRVPGAVKTFEEVRSQITSTILLRKMQHYIQGIIKEHKIKIKIYI